MCWEQVEKVVRTVAEELIGAWVYYVSYKQIILQQRSKAAIVAAFLAVYIYVYYLTVQIVPVMSRDG